jgi:glycosyltransferase involved in cell wall biosynthesis
VKTACIIVSTYNQPDLLDRSLYSLTRQSCPSFEIVVADDGSGPETRAVIESHAERAVVPVRHVWQEDDGFRKTRILNKAIRATAADYLLFTDGDCIAHPDFVKEHLAEAETGRYVNGSIIRLDSNISDLIGKQEIADQKVFDLRWLVSEGGKFNRRYLRFSLNHRLRRLLNAEAVNGFDHRFTYGFEDGDFGNRLENLGLTPKTVRWTANLLHLWHERPWSNPEVLAYNKSLMTAKEKGGRYRAIEGLAELADAAEHDVSTQQVK